MLTILMPRTIPRWEGVRWVEVGSCEEGSSYAWKNVVHPSSRTQNDEATIRCVDDETLLAEVNRSMENKFGGYTRC